MSYSASEPDSKARLHHESLRGRLWLVTAMISGCAWQHDIHRPDSVFWETDFPRGREIMEGIAIRAGYRLTAMKSLALAALSGKTASGRPLREAGWSRSVALMSVLVVCIPGRRKDQLAGGGVVRSLPTEPGGDPYHAGCRQWLEVDLRSLAWGVFRDMDHHA